MVPERKQGSPDSRRSPRLKIAQVSFRYDGSSCFRPRWPANRRSGFPLHLVKANERLSSLWKFPPNSSIKDLDSRGNILVDTLHPLNIGTHETDPYIIR